MRIKNHKMFKRCCAILERKKVQCWLEKRWCQSFIFLRRWALKNLRKFSTYIFSRKNTLMDFEDTFEGKISANSEMLEKLWAEVAFKFWNLRQKRKFQVMWNSCNIKQYFAKICDIMRSYDIMQYYVNPIICPLPALSLSEYLELSILIKTRWAFHLRGTMNAMGNKSGGEKQPLKKCPNKPRVMQLNLEWNLQNLGQKSDNFFENNDDFFSSLVVLLIQKSLHIFLWGFFTPSVCRMNLRIIPYYFVTISQFWSATTKM